MSEWSVKFIEILMYNPQAMKELGGLFILLMVMMGVTFHAIAGLYFDNKTRRGN